MPVIPSGLTVTQRRIMELLSDGGLHSKRELTARCVEGADEQSGYGALRYHVHMIRKQLQGTGTDVITSRNGIAGYRWVRLLSSSEE